jgi:serine/threonine protein kinase
MTLPVNTQKLKWFAEDNRCIAMFGVKGTPLSKLGNLTIQQKQSIGKQIGAFLKQLHSLKPDYSGQNLDDELQEYKRIYDDCADFFEKHFSKEEQEALDYLMHTYLPTARKNLGENLVFSHADIFEPNILLDDNGIVGIIDCCNAGYFDEAADFGIEDEILRGFILDYYGASDTLRNKVEVKYDMSTITCPKFGIPLWGESFIIEKWIPLIRKVITKYKNHIS